MQEKKKPAVSKRIPK